MSNKISEIWDQIQEEKKNPKLREKRLKAEAREFYLDLEWRFLNIWIGINFLPQKGQSLQ